MTVPGTHFPPALLHRSVSRLAFNPVPPRYAREYLEAAAPLSWLVAGNLAIAVIGLRWYVDRGLASVSTFAWPLFADSPAATVLGAIAFATLLPLLGRPLEAMPDNRPLAYLHTLAFVWLVETGLWTVTALNVGFAAYFPEPLAYFGVIASHLAFVAEAYLLPHAVRTTRGALAFALTCALANDVLDYAFGLNPPLRYDPGIGLAVASVGTSVLAVALAALAFERSGGETTA
ncbi:MAG: DUF1405 domain-containing protein [Haloglomus sp.]